MKKQLRGLKKKERLYKCGQQWQKNNSKDVTIHEVKSRANGRYKILRGPALKDIEQLELLLKPPLY